jgi:hypothetical protein
MHVTSRPAPNLPGRQMCSSTPSDWHAGHSVGVVGASLGLDLEGVPQRVPVAPKVAVAAVARLHGARGEGSIVLESQPVVGADVQVAPRVAFAMNLVAHRGGGRSPSLHKATF